MNRRHDLHQYEAVTMPDDAERPPRDHPMSIAVMRALSIILECHRLCLSPRCRRIGKCKGDPHECLDACRSLLVGDVYDGALVYLEGKIEGFSFDQIVGRYPDQIAALAEWTGRVAYSPVRRRGNRQQH
jgi:hypothetical protein